MMKLKISRNFSLSNIRPESAFFVAYFFVSTVAVIKK